jgi:hypothetical protein
MPNWSGGILTTKGQALQAKVDAGQTLLTLTKMKIGSGVLPSGQSLQSLNDLVVPEMNVPISAVSAEGNISTITGVITNAGLINGFNVRELGVFAQDPTLGEILYSITTDSAPDYLPPEGGAVTVSSEFNYHITVSNAANVTATLNPSGLVTVSILQQHKTASILDHPDNSVTDIKIGNRTITDTVTAAAGAGTITNLLSKIGNMIKRITGKSNWYTAPAITLEDVSNHTTATSGAHAASAISSTATGDVAATNVQAAITELASEKAALSGATFTGAINEAMVTMASAGTMAIGAAAGNLISVTGATTITAFDTVQAGVKRTLRFVSPLTITHNALSLLLPGNANITVGNGDVMEFASFGGGNWRCTNYHPWGGYAHAGYGLGTTANNYTGDIDKTAWETGFYYVRVTATGTKPYDYGHMIVMVESAVATIKQIWLTNITNDMQIRQCVNGVWSDWKKIATTDSFDYSTEITATNWNALTKNGKYYVIGTSALAINGPLPAGDANHLFYLDVINGTSTRTNYISQQATNITTGVLYTRKNQGGTWSAWKQVATTDQTTYITASGSGTGYYWRKWSNGDIEQWFTGAAMTTETSASLTFPIAFPTECKFVFPTVRTSTYGSSNNGWFQVCGTPSTTAVTIGLQSADTLGGASYTPLIYAVGN